MRAPLAAPGSPPATSLRFDRAWATAWRDLGVAAPPAALRDELLRRYAEPHRRYHTQQHLAECLALFDAHRALAQRPGEVAIALWFHDAVYETTRGGNERASADRAAAALRAEGLPDDVAERVHALVMATRHDGVPATPDACLLVDVDLAILGADRARFDEYERQIRDEYAHVPETLFRAGRGEILRAFLDRPTIYATSALHALRESTARANLARAIGALA